MSFGPVCVEGGSEPRRRSNDLTASSIIRSAATGTRTIVNFNDLPEMTAPELAGLADDLIKDEGLTARGGESWWHFEVRTSLAHDGHS